MSKVKNDFDIKDHDGSTVGLMLGGTRVTATAAELNTIDGVTATATELNETFLCTFIADLTAEATHYIVCPHAGSITKIWSVTNGSVATADITLTFNIVATPITNGVVTIATAASAATPALVTCADASWPFGGRQAQQDFSPHPWLHT